MRQKDNTKGEKTRKEEVRSVDFINFQQEPTKNTKWRKDEKKEKDREQFMNKRVWDTRRQPTTLVDECG